MFILFLDCASEVVMANPPEVAKVWYKNYIFTFRLLLRHNQHTAIYFMPEDYIGIHDL